MASLAETATQILKDNSGTSIGSAFKGAIGQKMTDLKTRMAPENIIRQMTGSDLLALITARAFGRDPRAAADIKRQQARDKNKDYDTPFGYATNRGAGKGNRQIEVLERIEKTLKRSSSILEVMYLEMRKADKTSEKQADHQELAHEFDKENKEEQTALYTRITDDLDKISKGGLETLGKNGLNGQPGGSSKNGGLISSLIGFGETGLEIGGGLLGFKWLTKLLKGGTPGTIAGVAAEGSKFGKFFGVIGRSVIEVEALFTLGQIAGNIYKEWHDNPNQSFNTNVIKGISDWEVDYIDKMQFWLHGQHVNKEQMKADLDKTNQQLEDDLSQLGDKLDEYWNKLGRGLGGFLDAIGNTYDKIEKDITDTSNNNRQAIIDKNKRGILTTTPGSRPQGGRFGNYQSFHKGSSYFPAIPSYTYSPISTNIKGRGSSEGLRYTGEHPSADYVANWFVKKGYTAAEAAAITGNLIQESQLYTGAGGDNGSAFGLAQWRLDRQSDFLNYANSRNKSPTDTDTQLEYIDKEIHGQTPSSPTDRGNNSVWNLLNSSRMKGEENLPSLTDLISSVFEVPLPGPTENLPGREQNAQDVYNKLVPKTSMLAPSNKTVGTHLTAQSAVHKDIQTAAASGGRSSAPVIISKGGRKITNNQTTIVAQADVHNNDWSVGEIQQRNIASV